jgi:heme iron utilization protein
MTTRPDPIQPADDAARALAKTLLALDHAALAWISPDTGAPGISRIAFARDPAVGPLTLISGLAAHYPALRANRACAVMLGEVGAKGDPLTHPRLMFDARAEFVAPDDPGRPALRDRWLQRAPKSAVYLDLPDFVFVRLVPQAALLNGGFGKAHRLLPEDL